MNQITLGMVGAGRASELHMAAYARLYGILIRKKCIIAKRWEQVQAAKERYGFENASLDFNDLLLDPEIDVIDICTPPYAHGEMIKRALAAGKHVICEKPLTGYFGEEGDLEPIGDTVSKTKMFETTMRELNALREIVRLSPKCFMYAENFIYAPAIRRAGELITQKKSRILFMKGEESLAGSSSRVAGEWSKTGGGTFMRTGTHPLSAILWLKQQEAKVHGENIQVKSVLADMGRVTPRLSEYEHRHIAARPHDVEDLGTVILTFSDESRAVIMATDTLLGGSRNYVEAYCNDAVIMCKLTQSDLLETFFPDADRLQNVSLSEMLSVKTGWNKPFVEDEMIRGYMAQIQDFMECITRNREPTSSFDLAYDTVRVIYAAYMSAELGKRVELDAVE